MQAADHATTSINRWKVLSLLPWGMLALGGFSLAVWHGLAEENGFGRWMRNQYEGGTTATGAQAWNQVRQIPWAIGLGLVALALLVFLVRWTQWQKKEAPERKGEFKRAWFRGDRVRFPVRRLLLCLAVYGARYAVMKNPDWVSDKAPVEAGLAQLGLALAVVAGCALVGWLVRRLAIPSDTRIDLWLRELIESARDQSLGKLGLVKEELTKEEIILIGFTDDMQLIPEGDRWLRKGKDKIIRFTPLSLTILQFTERHLGVYRAVLNFIRDVQLNERTDEFFYKDVVSVTTQRESHAFTLYSVKVDEALQFSLAVSSGDRVTQRLPIGELDRFVSPVSTKAEQAVNNIRQMLREKK